jgi:hypothetical protein
LTVKKTPASRPRDTTAVGIPRAARNTPRGTSRGTAGTSSAAATPATTAASTPGCCAAQLSAEIPTAAASAAGTSPGRRAAAVRPGSGGPSFRTAGTTSATASPTNGTRPRNTQCQDSVSVTTPDTGGPISEGSTHAEDTRPNTAGRARSA